MEELDAVLRNLGACSRAGWTTSVKSQIADILGHAVPLWNLTSSL